jgi:DNA-binding HxlR family transcriptional regulator
MNRFRLPPRKIRDLNSRQRRVILTLRAIRATKISKMAKAVVTCPVEEAIRVIGGKWKLLVLRSLLLNGPQRYNELLKTVTGISQKELTRNLRELTSAGLVTGAYELTKLGKGLMPTFKRLLTWGTHLPVR